MCACVRARVSECVWGYVCVSVYVCVCVCLCMCVCVECSVGINHVYVFSLTTLL